VVILSLYFLPSLPFKCPSKSNISAIYFLTNFCYPDFMQVFAVDIGKEYGVADKFGTLGEFFSTILFNIYGLAGIIFLFLLIFGGISIIIGAGNQDSSKVQKGQKAVTSAVAGFVVIFVSYFVIQLIQVITGVNILEAPF